MLREIIHLTREIIDSDDLLLNLQPTEGIHILVTLDEKDDSLIKYQHAFFKKNTPTPDAKIFLERESLVKWVSANKAVDRSKKIHSASPFCICFKRQSKDKILDSLEGYFKSIAQFCCSNNQRNWSQKFYNFCQNNLMKKIDEIEQKVIQEQTEQAKKKKPIKLKDSLYIYVYLENVSVKDYRQCYQKHLEQKTFNSDKYNMQIENKTYGVADYLTGFNSKKPYLLHQNAPFNINLRVSSEDAVTLFLFSKLVANKQLPNPLPIFIEKKELNEQMVKIYNQEGQGKIGYSKILHKIYDKKKDLGNYYLFNFQWGRLQDFDFVSSFSYPLKIKIENIFKAGEISEILNVFEFEKVIVQKIFNNQLIQKTKTGIRYRYFDEIDNNAQYISAATYHTVMKYRRAFYDYVYKSKRHNITTTMFHDIMKTLIRDDIRHDQFKDNKHTKGYSVREKLNILFSLYYFFESSNNSKEVDMPDKVKDLRERMLVLSENQEGFRNDEEFAFAAGQIIYYLLNQSEAQNKTHALLEPFLQKSSMEQFQQTILRTFNRYKHAIHFNNARFNNLMSNVLGYSLENNTLKTLMVMIIAGYFSDNVIYKKRES